MLGVYVILRFGFSFKRLRSCSHHPSRSSRFPVTTDITESILAFKLGPVVCLDSLDFTTKWKQKSTASCFPRRVEARRKHIPSFPFSVHR